MLPFLGGLPVASAHAQSSPSSLTAFAGSFGVFHVFDYWLKVPLPIGALGL